MTKPSARQPSRQRPRRCAGQLGPGHRVDVHQPGLQRSRRHLSRHPPRLRTSRRIHQASDNHLSTREPPAQPAAMAARPPRAGRRALPPPRGRAASGGRLDGEGDPVRQPRRRGLAQHLRRLAACPASRTVRQHRSHTSRCSSTAAPPRDPAPRPGTPSAAGHGSHDCPCATPASASNWASRRRPRCTRASTVPRGHPRASAASRAVYPATSTSTVHQHNAHPLRLRQQPQAPGHHLRVQAGDHHIRHVRRALPTICAGPRQHLQQGGAGHLPRAPPSAARLRPGHVQADRGQPRPHVPAPAGAKCRQPNPA